MSSSSWSATRSVRSPPSATSPSWRPCPRPAPARSCARPCEASLPAGTNRYRPQSTTRPRWRPCVRSCGPTSPPDGSLSQLRHVLQGASADTPEGECAADGDQREEDACFDELEDTAALVGLDERVVVDSVLL